MKFPLHRDSAFSLVEITLAIGIVAFTLVSLVGLFGAGLKVTRESGNDVALAKVAANVFASTDIANLSDSNPSVEFFFNQEGKPMSAGQDAFYKCDVTYRYAGQGEIAGVASRLRLLTLKIEWPGGHRTFHSTAAK